MQRDVGGSKVVGGGARSQSVEAVQMSSPSTSLNCVKNNNHSQQQQQQLQQQLQLGVQDHHCRTIVQQNDSLAHHHARPADMNQGRLSMYTVTV